MKKNILICGVGSLGSNLVANLIADLPIEYKITILDYDKVEERNTTVGTQFFTPKYIGTPKVDALQDILFEWYEKEIGVINKKLEYEDVEILDIFEKTNLIIDCFDNSLSRSIVQEYWFDIKYRDVSKGHLLHCGFSKDMTFALEWAENYKVPTDIEGFDICEMPGAGSFVKRVASLASLVVQDFITTGTKREFIGNKFNQKEIL